MVLQRRGPREAQASLWKSAYVSLQGKRNGLEIKVNQIYLTVNLKAN